MELRSRSLSPPLERPNDPILPDNIIEVSPPRHMREQSSPPMTEEILDSPNGQMDHYKQWRPRIQQNEFVTNYGYNRILIGNDFKPRLPTFDGRPDTFEPFLMQFRLFAKSYIWSEREFREQFLLALRGEALFYASSLPNITTENTESLLHAIRQRFGQSLLPDTHRANLYNIKKQPKENLLQYSDRVSRHMLRAYPGMQGTAIYETLAIEYLLRGLPDQNLAYEIFLENPTNLLETVEMITWHETCHKLTCSSKTDEQKTQSTDCGRLMSQTENENKSVRKTATETNSDNYNKSNSSQMENKTNIIKKSIRQRKCYNCRRKGHLADSCPREKTIPETNSDNNNKSISSLMITNIDDIKKSTKQRKCYNCRRRGHLAVSCPREKTVPDTNSDNNNKSTSSLMTTNIDVIKKSTKQRKCYNCRRKGHLADSCLREKTIPETNSGNNNKSPSSLMITNTDVIKKSTKRRKCYNCRRRGHLADSCHSEKTIPRQIRTLQQN